MGGDFALLTISLLLLLLHLEAHLENTDVTKEEAEKYRYWPFVPEQTSALAALSPVVWPEKWS